MGPRHGRGREASLELRRGKLSATRILHPGVTGRGRPLLSVLERAAQTSSSGIAALKWFPVTVELASTTRERLRG